MIKTTDKTKKRQTPDAFIAGADVVEKSPSSTKPRGVKMKTIAIPLGLADKLSAYVTSKNEAEYVRVSETAVIIEALDSFLKSQI